MDFSSKSTPGEQGFNLLIRADQNCFFWTIARFRKDLFSRIQKVLFFLFQVKSAMIQMITGNESSSELEKTLLNWCQQCTQK